MSTIGLSALEETVDGRETEEDQEVEKLEPL